MQAQADLTEAAPTAEHMQVVSHFRHLGVVFGPTSHRVRWEAPFAKYLVRAVGIRQARGPFVECRRMYCVLAFSVLNFIVSFDRPPADCIHLEARGIARALGLPMHSMLAEFMASFTELGFRRFEPQLRSFSLAARLNLIRRIRYLWVGVAAGR